MAVFICPPFVNIGYCFQPMPAFQNLIFLLLLCLFRFQVVSLVNLHIFEAALSLIVPSFHLHKMGNGNTPKFEGEFGVETRTGVKRG